MRWKGGGSRRFWLALAVSVAGLAASLTLMAKPSVWFLALFILPTLFVGIAAMFHRASPGVFIFFALSDVAMAVGLTSYQSETSSWLLPGRGDWGAAALWACAAALLRLAAPIVARDRQSGVFVAENCSGARLRRLESLPRKLIRRPGVEHADLPPIDGAFTLIGWFQGVFLAWWVGGSGAVALGAGGVLICLGAAIVVRSSLPVLGLAGGVVAMVTAAGLGTGAMLSTALAGVAYVLGERLISVWILGLGPLSSVGWAALQPDLPAIATIAFLAPLVLAALAICLCRVKPGLPGGRLLAVIAGLGTIGAALEMNGTWAWILYGSLLSGLATVLLVRPTEPEAPLESLEPGLEPQEKRVSTTASLAILLPGAAIFAGAVIIAAMLLIKGLETGFL